MKKKIFSILVLSAIFLIAVFGFINTVFEKDKLLRENVEAMAVDPIRCDGGPEECARILVGTTTHLFYEPLKPVEET